MTDIRRAGLLGAVLWLVSHGPLPALLSLGEHRNPVLALTALAAVLVVSAVAVRPLHAGPMELSTPAAVAMAVVVPLSGLAVTPFLPESAWRTYGNWWPGLTQVIVAALVMRRHWRAALGAEVASAVVLALCVLPSDLPNRAVALAALNQPALVWFAASLGVRSVFDRAMRDIDRFTADAGAAAAARAAAQASVEARDRSARQRRADLEHRTLPVLRRVSRTEPDAVSWPVLSRAAMACERLLRDDLRARTLLDDDVRTALRQARRRGAEVDVVDDRRDTRDAEFTAALRRVLAPALQHCGTARVTVRLSPVGQLATVSVDGSAAEAEAVARALRVVLAATTTLQLSTDLHEGSLWAEVQPVPAPT